MGSEQNQRNGLDRDTDGAKGWAHQFTILGVDIDPEALKKRYEGTKRHGYVCAVIDGLVQKQRTKTGKAPAWMVRLMRANSSHVPPIKVADLGRDGTQDGWENEKEKGAKRGKRMGKNWTLVDDGRQRVMARRELDAEAEAEGRPKQQLSCTYETYSAKDTRRDATTSRVVANLREPRSFSSRAEDAADMARDKYADEDIAPFVEAKDADEVAALRALHTCVDDVKDAVDAGRVLLKTAAGWSKFSDEIQLQRLARALQTTKAGKDAAAPPRMKAQPAAKIKALADAIEETAGTKILQVLRWCSGEMRDPPKWIADALAGAAGEEVEAAE